MRLPKKIFKKVQIGNFYKTIKLIALYKTTALLKYL